VFKGDDSKTLFDQPTRLSHSPQKASPSFWSVFLGRV
jgi:hypothetical protein